MVVLQVRKAAAAFLLAYLVILTPSSASGMEPGGPVAPEFRTEPGEPRRLPPSAFVKPELYLRAVGVSNATALVLRSAGELDLETSVVHSRPWMEEAYSSTSTFDLGGAAVLAVSPIPHGRSTRRMHVELIPVAGSGDVAVKFWEACDPSLAPDSTVRGWHLCGGHPSRAFRALVETMKQQIALADGDALR